MVKFVQRLIVGFLFICLWAGSLETGDPVLFTVAVVYTLVWLTLLGLRSVTDQGRPRRL